MALSAAADGVKVPLPLVVHTPLKVLLAVALKVCVLLLQMVAVPPVASIGAGVMFITTVSASVPHLPLLMVETTNDTVPVVLSPAEGK